jgi:hypothetical protein
LTGKFDDISYFEWRSTYSPIKNHLEERTSFDGELFGIDGDELDFVEDMDEGFVWTYFSGDDGMYITNGRYSDDVAGYLISSNRWASGDKIRVTL